MDTISERVFVALLVAALLLSMRGIYRLLAGHNKGEGGISFLRGGGGPTKLESSLLVVQAERKKMEQDLERLTAIHLRNDERWRLLIAEYSNRELVFMREIHSLRVYTLELSKSVCKIFDVIKKQCPDFNLEDLPKIPDPPESQLGDLDPPSS